MNGAELIGNRHRIRRELRGTQLVQLLQSRHADLEELIEVARGDAQEFQPLQQRNRLIERLRQDALIELQERQFPVDVVLGGFEIRRIHWFFPAGRSQFSIRVITIQ